MNTPLSAALAAALRAERAAKQITLANVATSTGISLSSIKRYFKGAREIDTEILEKLSKALGVRASELMRQAEQRINLADPNADFGEIVTFPRRDRP